MTLMRGISTWTNHREQICEKRRAARGREGKGERERGRPKKEMLNVIVEFCKDFFNWFNFCPFDCIPSYEF